MDRPQHTELPDTPEKHNGDIDHDDREQKTADSTITHLLRSARRIVEEKAWKHGMVWYPADMLRQSSSSELAKRVFPNIGTAAARACAQSIRVYTGKPLTEDEARDWLAREIDERLDKFVIGARAKINEVRLVVTERKIKVRAERPDTTRKAVGPAPWSTQL